MQLPKQFKSWVSFYKYLKGSDASIAATMDNRVFNHGMNYVAEMALNELLAAMPNDTIDIRIMAISCENADRHKAAKFLFKLCDILT